MSRTIHRAPLAVTSDGTVLVNVTYLDATRDLRRLLEHALRERGAVFVGLVLTPAERKRLAWFLDGPAKEAAARVRRPRRRRSRS